jgi:hypothetical protein
VDYTEIRYEKRGEVTIITFDRPEVLNCIGPVTHRELCDAWGRFRDDETVKVAIITGNGERAFCTGGDLKRGVLQQVHPGPDYHRGPETVPRMGPPGQALGYTGENTRARQRVGDYGCSSMISNGDKPAFSSLFFQALTFHLTPLLLYSNEDSFEPAENERSKVRNHLLGRR